MQNLLIDIGNTRLKWAIENDGNFRRGEDVTLEGMIISQLVDSYWHDLNPDHIMISCVANEKLEQELLDVLASKWVCNMSALRSPASGLGINNSYTQPEKLGSDRWAAMVAAYNQLKGAACIVDCGSAVTVDAIDSVGQHLGGLIVPGLALAQRSLQQGTNLNFGNDPALNVPELLGKSTEQCIQYGCIEQLSGLINQVYQQLHNQHESMTLILTGGDADLIKSRLSSDVIIEPDLVLKGLAIILQSSLG